MAVSRTNLSLNALALTLENNLDPIWTFSRAGTAKYFNSSGVLVDALSSKPRFDYDPSTLAPRGLLIEEARTNLVTQSADVSHADWTKNSSAVATGTAAPDGTTSKKITELAATATHNVSQTKTVTTATRYTSWAILKAAERTWAFIDEGAGVTASAYFNLSTGVLGTVAGTGSPVAGIEPLGSGWYLCWLSFTSSGTSANCRIGCATGDLTSSYLGVVSSGIYHFASQLEAGAGPTSYIPTTTASASRVADVLTCTPLVAPWFNTAGGTLFMEFIIRRGPSTYGTLFNVRTSDTVMTEVRASDTAGDWAVTNSSAQASGSWTPAFESAGVGAVNKIALAYKANDFAFAHNGGTVQTDTSGTIPAFTSASVINLLSRNAGTLPLSGWIRRFQFIPHRVPDIVLKQLTV